MGREPEGEIRPALKLSTIPARQMPSAIAAPLLAGLLKTEPDINVCAAAIEVLAEIGGSAELPSLEDCAARFPAEFFLAFSVKTASGRIHARAGL